MAVDYNDERFKQVENEKNNAVNGVNNTYDQMIKDSDKYYNDQVNALKDYEKKQTELQNAQTNLTIEKVNQAKEQAEKEYQKEQKGAYVDYQKAIDNFGVNSEKLATQGLTNTGYAESTRTNVYNTYQNRYMTARESYNNAIINYNNSIKEAQLANSSALAQLAYETLQKQLELSLQGFQYKNSLLQSKLNAVNEEKDRYYARWQDVLNQINTENNFAEQQRQFNEQMALNREQFDFNKKQAEQEQANWEKEYALSKENADRDYQLSLASLNRSSSSSKSTRK